MNGEIAMIKAKIVPINEIISATVSNIKKTIDDTPEVSVAIDVGKATGIQFLSNMGPTVNMKLETARWS